MDMKKILQAFDGASTKPVEGSNDMSKFLSIIDKNNVGIIKEELDNNTVLNEGANPHKVSLPVQMAMQHYQEPAVEKPRTIKEVKKSAMSSLLYQYYTEAQQEISTEESSKKEVISEQAKQIASRILAKESRLDELSKETLQSYKGKAEKEADEYEKAGDAYDSDPDERAFAPAAYKKAEKRREGAKRAGEKIAAKESFNHAEYDQEGEAASNDLKTAEEAAEELRSILSSNENLPEWVQEKITKAVDYLDTVRDYMKSVDESRYGHRDAYQRDYDSSRTGFGRREREDDEYHVPDPVDNRIAYKVIATVTTQDGNEEKKGVSVKTRSGPLHAEQVATKHLEGAGFQVKSIDSVHDLGPV